MISELDSILSFILTGLWQATWQASALAVVVLSIQWMLGKRLGGRGRFALWAVVVVRLLLPALPESRFSVFNLAKTRMQPSTVIPATHQPQIPVIMINPIRASTPQVASVSNPAPQVSHAIRLSAWLFAAWIAGVLTLALRVAHVCWDLSRTIRKLSRVSDAHLVEMLRSCAALLRVRKIPVVLSGDNVQTPAVVGLFRAKLLLPSHVLSSCNDREIRLIFLHELAHLKRHDIAGNWLIALASILHWFNPIVWLLSARMRADRELACDEMVLHASSGEAKAYGHTLLKLIEILSPKVRSLAVSPRELAIVGILESTTPMQRRVRMIAQFDPKQSRRWIWTVLVLGALGCMTLTDAVKGEKATTRPASQPSAEASGRASAGSSYDEAAIEKSLDKTLPEVKFDQVALSDVMDFFREQSGANLIVNWKALEAAGIDRSAEVSIRLKNVTLRQALDHILSNVGGSDVGGGSVKLGHSILDGAIVVSTDEDVSRNTTTMAYDVSDLLQPMQNETHQNTVDRLLKLVQQMVMPETWKSNGGAVGDISELNGKLVVQNTQAAQEKVAELLKLMRTASASNLATPGAANLLYQPPMLVGGGQAMPAPVIPHTIVADAEIEQANRLAIDLLNKKLPEVRCKGMPASDVIDYLRDVTGANIYVKWKALEIAGVATNNTVTVVLKNASLQSVLSAWCEDLEPSRAVIVIDRGLIVITTREDLPSYMITKTYDVKDFAGGEDITKLAQVVQSLTISELGQPSVQTFGNKLIVTALPDAHEQVQKLLADLRNDPTTQPAR